MQGERTALNDSQRTMDDFVQVATCEFAGWVWAVSALTGLRRGPRPGSGLKPEVALSKRVPEPG
jgi:hypothetical protein